MGGKIQSCHNIARKIWEWAIERNIWLLSTYIPGKANAEADKLSRSLNENTEWALSKEMFKKLIEHFPGLEIDLFASHLNNKLPRYVSWLSDAKATYCDAFSLDWSKFYAYAFPPFNLIGKVLRKVEMDESDLLLIVPEWPSQYWFAKIRDMLCEEPFYFPRSSRTIYNPVKKSATPIKARFIAFKISGSTRKCQAYRKI